MKKFESEEKGVLDDSRNYIYEEDQIELIEWELDWSK